MNEVDQAEMKIKVDAWLEYSISNFESKLISCSNVFLSLFDTTLTNWNQIVMRVELSEQLNFLLVFLR